MLLLLSCNRAIVSSNSKAAEAAPYLILISLDGFRWDYVDTYRPPHLSAFIEGGVKAESLIPCFPTKTFPNHYSIATGMYPDKHGLVGNTFYSRKKEQLYKISDRARVEDGTFYGGTPIWVQANRANMVSASYFFVGSEADVQGKRPTYYYPYDGSVKNETRVSQVLEWLQLPAKKRPHLITMYFSDMDDIGHRYGPGNKEEIKKALFELDEHLGNLFAGVKAGGLSVNIIIVSDHGMADLSNGNKLPIEEVQNDSLYMTIDNGAIINIHPRPGVSVEAVMQYLQPKENRFKVYLTEETPEFAQRPQNEDWGAVQIVAEPGYYFSSLRSIALSKRGGKTVVGVHGYAPAVKDMHGIFYANGPAFKQGYTLHSVKNVHIYPLMCRLLGLEIPANIDGELDQIKGVLK